MSDNQTPSSPDANEQWAAFITGFATSIGKTVDEATEGLKKIVGEPGEEAIELLKNEEFCPMSEIQAHFPDVPTARLRKSIQSLRITGRETKEAAPAVIGAASFDVLPSAPDDANWLSLLKAGGVLKVNTGVVVSGIRAALASRSGLFELPQLLIDRMETHAESLDEPAGAAYYNLRELLTKRNYAEVFAALGIKGSFATATRKNALIARLDERLWPQLRSFQGQLKAWVESWQAGFANPGMLVTALASFAGGGAGLPAGMMQPPETNSLRDAAESVVAIINSTFAGTGIPVASALAWDAKNITEVLENADLPAQVGAANREQMLKMLNVAVTADYVRLERNVTRFALGIMEFEKVPNGQSELTYIGALAMLGDQIPWDKLAAPTRRNSAARSNTAGRRRDDDEE